MTAWRHVIAVTIVTTALSAPSAGQTNGPDGGELDAWHVVRDVRPLLERDTPSAADVLSVARAELALGRADRAQEILDRYAHVLDTSDVATLKLRAEAALAEQEIEEAAQLFARAASRSRGHERGAYYVRAGEAYESAGYRRLAAAHYKNAGEELRAIRGWLAVREARVTDLPSHAFRLLRRATPPAQRLASLARADIYLFSGDSARAVDTFAAAGEHRRAAEVALVAGDDARAQAELFRVLDSDQDEDVAWALGEIESRFTPETHEHLLRLARAHRTSDRERAIRYAKRVVSEGDSSVATLILLADLQRDAGHFADALDMYAAARDRGSATAFYRYARLLDRVGRRTESRAALLQFAQRHPRSSVAPLAVFLVAEARRRQGRLTLADSLYRTITRKWPRAQYAGRARLQLASMAAAEADSAAVIRWYEEEIAVRGQQRYAARFLLANWRMATGDSTGGMAELLALARQDSIGYYGTIAREVGKIPAPRFAPAIEFETSEWVIGVLGQLDQLRAAGMADEIEEFVAHLTEQRQIEWRDMLALAEGLAERGWMAEALRLGWRVAERHTLNDTRVLQVIFPWPLRGLIESEAAEHDLDPYLVVGLIRQESAFRPAVVSRAGAVGLMQLMPATAREVARRSGVDWEVEWVTVADANLHVGATHLAGLLRHYGRVAPALAAYNAGGRPVARWLRHPEAHDTYRFVEMIPYVETRGYVRTILRNRELYRALYPEVAQTSATP